MSKVSERKTRLSFETDAEIRVWGTRKKKRCPVMRSIVVDVDNGWHGNVRLKGTRQKFSFSWEGLYKWAVAHEVARLRAEKKKSKAKGAGR